MEILPAIDLRGGQVVRLFQGDYDQMTVYSQDPCAQSRAFAQAGAHNLHLVDLDGWVAINGWKENSREKGPDFCRRLRDAGVKTVIYTDISRDGAEQGTNLELYRQLTELEGLQIIASGGISFESELTELDQMGVYGAILGKALYTGKLDLARAIQAVQR